MRVSVGGNIQDVHAIYRVFTQYTVCSRNDGISDFVGQFVVLSVCLRKVMEKI